MSESSRPEVWRHLRDGDLARAARSALVALESTADRATRAEMHGVLGTVELRLGNVADARDRFDQAVALGAPDDPGHATSLAQAAMSRFLLGDTAGATTTALQAQLHGKRLGDTFAVCEGYHVRALVALAEGRPAQALELARAALALREDVRTHVENPMSHLYVGLALLDLDQGDEAQEVLERGLALARVEGSVAQAAWFHGALARVALARGRWDAAESAAEAGERAALATGTRIAKANPTAIRAMVASARGDLALARSILEADPATPGRSLPGDLTNLARASASRTHSVAYDYLVDSWLRGRATPYFLQWRILLPLLTAAALRAGDRDAARQYAEEAAEGARRAEGVASAEGAALLCRALVDRDPATARAAIAAYRECGRPFSLAQAELALARTFAAVTGGQAEAIALLQEAHGIFHDLGLTRWTARAGRELVSVVSQEHVGAEQAPEPEGWDRLSPAEREVAALAAQGLTNPQIAAQLVVSPRTVQSHTSHIYAKLGISSRVQLAALVTQPTR